MKADAIDAALQAALEQAACGPLLACSAEGLDTVIGERGMKL